MANFEITQELIDALTYELEFGQHKGKSVEWLLENQSGYCEWILKQPPSNNKAFSKAKIMIMVGMGMDKAKVQEALGTELKHKMKKVQEDKSDDNDIFPTLLFAFMSQICDGSLFPKFDFLSNEDLELFVKLRGLWKNQQTDTYLMIQRANFGDLIVGFQAKKNIDKKNGRVGKMKQVEPLHA